MSMNGVLSKLRVLGERLIGIRQEKSNLDALTLNCLLHIAVDEKNVVYSHEGIHGADFRLRHQHNTLVIEFTAHTVRGGHKKCRLEVTQKGEVVLLATGCYLILPFAMKEIIRSSSDWETQIPQFFNNPIRIKV